MLFFFAADSSLRVAVELIRRVSLGVSDLGSLLRPSSESFFSLGPPWKNGGVSRRAVYSSARGAVTKPHRLAGLTETFVCLQSGVWEVQDQGVGRLSSW